MKFQREYTLVVAGIVAVILLTFAALTYNVAELLLAPY